MKKIFLICGLATVVLSCNKQEKKGDVVGTNEKGEELVVNAKGDTIVATPETESETEATVEEKEEVAFTPKEDGTYEFGFNLKKGEKYPFKIITTATSKQSDGTQSITINQESTTELEYLVKDVTADGFVMDVTYKRFAEKMSNGQESIGFDTNAGKPKDERATQRWKVNKAIVGNSFGMTIDKHGKVKSVTNLSKIRDKVKAEIKNDLKKEEIAVLDQFLQSAINDQVIKNMFEESVGYYPTKPVKKGDKWDKTQSAKTAKSTINYTFDGVNNNLATIKINGKSSGSDSQTDPKSGIKVSSSLKGNVTGTVNVDEKSGWIKNATMNKTETMTMSQELNGQKATMTTEVKSTTKIN